MNNSELINESLIALNVRAKTKDEALKKVANIAFNAGRVKSAKNYLDGLMERENTSTTGFGGGIAIPHAKIDEVLKPTITVIKLKEAVEWKAMDDKPVQLLIALAIPTKQEGTLHLKLLAKLSENLMEEEFTDSLLSANTENEIYQTITSIFE
ncbi:PTS sugar transporter subunit IIA [Virgibacillus oceani]|uniref:PTS mannose transporter subunit IIAB n=1 Tax=Virgibacillus oceani TaxID=1479511 RepID=A0A917HIN5_9BACI|nr:PTS sugar transporter subunit IIA [Virgibacillus oceani]GGG79747.1 PTS mannose transporter subunit IIAB [Virgibacillus oceani]